MAYWIFEYVKVLAAYLVLLYVWPNFLFGKFLKGKGNAYRFAFSSVVSVLLLNTVVLVLGLVHLLNPWVVRLLFYGPVLGRCAYCVYQRRDLFIHVKHLLTGICSPKRFCTMCLEYVGNKVKQIVKKFLGMVRKSALEYGMLTILIVFGMMYFGYGAFQERFYGATDMYVHHSWIYELTQGNIFSAGVYPEGMHCFIYSMNTLFGIEIYSCLLFLGGIHIMAYLVAAYLLFREFFVWKFSGMFVLAMFLVMGLDNIDQISSMARLQWTIPQEFGFFAMFLCATYLFKYFKEGPQIVRIGRKQKIGYDANLLVFWMALAVTIVVHFYVTMMAFFLCAGITLCFLKKVFSKRYFYPLVIGVFSGVLAAVLPMAGALASGMEFQGSIEWALGVMDVNTNKENNEQSVIWGEEKKKSEFEISLGNDSEGITIIPNEPSETTDISNVNESTAREESSLKEDIVNFIKGASLKCVEILKKIYRCGYKTLYNDWKAEFFLAFTAVGLLLGVGGEGIRIIRRKSDKRNRCHFGYLHLVASAILVLFLYAGSNIGLPQLIDRSRVCSTIHLLLIAIVMIPVDLVFFVLGKFTKECCREILSVVCCFGIYFIAIRCDFYHSYLFYSYSRYPKVVEQTREIIDNMEPHTYTVVSCVDEIYQIIENGFHEELVVFLKNSKEEHYTLPTEYVFCYVEKQPLVYAQHHFSHGPTWLANTDYHELYSNKSEHPDALRGEVSEEAANSDVVLPLSSKSYSVFNNRIVVQSRMYEWCQRFMELYPGQMQTVYEDDVFVCYAFRQNPARLFELAITQ